MTVSFVIVFQDPEAKAVFANRIMSLSYNVAVHALNLC